MDTIYNRNGGEKRAITPQAHLYVQCHVRCRITKQCNFRYLGLPIYRHGDDLIWLSFS